MTDSKFAALEAAAKKAHEATEGLWEVEGSSSAINEYLEQVAPDVVLELINELRRTNWLLEVYRDVSKRTGVNNVDWQKLIHEAKLRDYLGPGADSGKFLVHWYNTQTTGGCGTWKSSI